MKSHETIVNTWNQLEIVIILLITWRWQSMRICSPCLQKKGPQGSGIREMQDLLKCHLRLKQQMQQWHTNTINEARCGTSKTYGCVWKYCVPHCTQWFCWSLSLLNGYNWGYTLFSDKPIWKHGGQTGCGRRARAKCTISDSKSSSNRCLDTFETFKQSAWHPVWKQLVAKSGPSCYNAILHKFFHLERLQTLLILWHRSDCGGSPSLINDKGSTNLRSCPRPLLCQASVNEEWNCAMFAPPKKLSHTKTASYYHLAHCKVKLL